jgi:dihydroorotase-like cyclic amidohydrolase
MPNSNPPTRPESQAQALVDRKLVGIAALVTRRAFSTPQLKRLPGPTQATLFTTR